MIGVTPAARLAWWISRLGAVPYFEKANWLDVLPEYNPFKYNSFPANAAFQTASLTRAVQADLDRVTSRGRLDAIPPILTFQSIVDATVSTPAVVHALYDRLPANGSELVLFDVNHLSGIDVFLQPADRSLVETLLDRAPRNYRRVVVTNAAPDRRDVEARTAEPGVVSVTRRPLGLAWPAEVFSLTHIALPFAANDPLYGIDGSGEIAGLLPIGRLSPRGERAVLTVGADTLMRLSSNPFFPFIADQIGNGWAPAPPGNRHPVSRADDTWICDPYFSGVQQELVRPPTTGASEGRAPAGAGDRPREGRLGGTLHNVAVVGETLSRYRLVAHLGSGAMGDVYRAEDLRLRRTVALKVVRAARDPEETSRRLLAEARAGSAFTHPNIAVVYEVDEVEHDGGSSASSRWNTWLDGRWPISPRRVLCLWIPSSTSAARWPMRWPPRTRKGWCTATSSPRTSWSPKTAW